MKGLLVSLLLLVLTCLPTFASNSRETISKSMHEVLIVQPMEEGYCTAYAVGQKTIMIAEHCISKVPETDLFIFDEYGTGKGPYAVAEKILLDNNDHAILVLRALDLETNKFTGFDTWIQDISFYSPKQGDKVIMWGAPSSLECISCYREGMFSGWTVKDDDGRVLMWFVLPVSEGDSGSLVFDSFGHLVGQVTYGHGCFMGSYPFSFIKEQTDQIK